MKKVKVCLNIILFFMFISILGIFNVKAASNPYKEKGPYGTNCTWYAWKVVNEKAGVSLPGWGDAKKWYNDAKNDGYAVGTTPKANSIIVWGNWTSYGHVGYVESVEGNTLYVWDSAGYCLDTEDPEFLECEANSVSEETSRICYANAKRIACEYTISPSDYEITGYIYLDEIPKKPASKPSQNDTASNNVVVTKSSNANLSDIVISNGTITFDKDVLKYNIEVENEVDKITINATTEDKKATIKGTGDYDLNVGLNEIKLIVTAENSSTKEYILEVTRNEKIEVEPEIDTDINSDTNDNQTEEVQTKDNNIQTIILVSSICFLIILGILIFVIKRKKHNVRK